MLANDMYKYFAVLSKQNLFKINHIHVENAKRES